MTWVSGMVPWLSREHGFVSNWEFFIQSGIGSCIAPNAGIAVPPVEGKSCHLRLPIGPKGPGFSRVGQVPLTWGLPGETLNLYLSWAVPVSGKVCHTLHKFYVLFCTKSFQIRGVNLS